MSEIRYEIRDAGTTSADTWSILQFTPGSPGGRLFRTLSTSSLDALTDALIAHREAVRGGKDEK